jgi:hypothetical protein
MWSTYLVSVCQQPKIAHQFPGSGFIEDRHAEAPAIHPRNDPGKELRVIVRESKVHGISTIFVKTVFKGFVKVRRVSTKELNVYIEWNVLRTNPDADDAASQNTIDVNQANCCSLLFESERIAAASRHWVQDYDGEMFSCLILTLESMQSCWFCIEQSTRYDNGCSSLMSGNSMVSIDALEG